MKRSLFILILLLMTFLTGFGQVDKGTWQAGGSLIFNHNSDNVDSRNTTFILSPSAGKFISGRMLIGGSLVFNYYNFKRTEDSYNKERSFGFGPYVRYHVFFNNSFAIYLQGDLRYESGTDKHKWGQEPERVLLTDRLLVGIRPGLVYFPVERLGLEAGLGSMEYIFEQRKEEDSGEKNKDHYYDFTLDMSSLVLGIRYYF